MTRPLIESGDITTSTGTGESAAVSHPAYNSGDLVIAFLGIDDDVTANNPQNPSTGPNGETLIYDLAGSGGSSGSGPTQCAIAWIGTATQSSGTVSFTWTGSEFWAARVIKVLAGEFDATTPLGAQSGFDGNTSSTGTTIATPSWALDATDGGGAILVHMVADADPITGNPAGWTITLNTDHGGLATAITQRDADSVDSETVASVDYTIAADSSSTLGIVIRPPSGPAITSIDSDYGAASDEFDVDENSLDVNGSLFESTQGSGTVWLGDEVTLAASSAEVDLADAINTWADAEVNLDLNDLGATAKTNVEALIVSDGPALFIILVNNSSEETSIPVTVHRAKAFAMSLSANIAASGENTTGQLTVPTSGSFGGGRIQDDENPADTVDIGDDEFFEDEWCIEALANSVFDETYLFRVLVGTSPAATITVIPGLTVEVAADSDIAAVITTALTVAADLKGAGQLDAVLALVVSVAADLTAEGNLAAANSLLLSVAADLDAEGRLSAALALAMTVAADLDAAGNLTAANAIIVSVAAEITEGEAKDVAAIIPLVMTVAASLRATGSLSAANQLALTVAADLSAEGNLDAAMSLVLAVAADLKGAGELTSAIALQLAVAADIRATGNLSASIVTALTVAANLSAVGRLNASTSIVLTVAANLVAASDIDLSAVLPIVISVDADLSALASLAAAPSMVISVAADLNATGRLEAATNLLVTLAGDLRAAGVLRGTLNINTSVAAALKARGELAVAQPIVISVSANLTDAGAVPVTAQVWRDVWTGLGG